MSRERAAPVLGATHWTSTDGKQMPWRIWPVAQGVSPRAIVIAIHGLSGAASDFVLLGERLPAQGTSVYAYELRGQGNDADVARRGDVFDREDWLRDLQTFHHLVRARHPGVPILWYGESLGSLIALHAADESSSDAKPDALILAAPLAGIRQPLSEVKRFLIRATSRLWPEHRVKLGDLAGVDESKIRVTSTTTHGAQMAKTPHHVENFTFRLLREVDSLMQSNVDVAKRSRLPVLMLASPHDVVASPDQVQALFKQLGTKDKKLLWYSQSYHLLLHDVQREDVVKDVLDWMQRR